MEYIALIHTNTDSPPSPEEWNQFFLTAKSSGMFKGGSEIGLRQVIGEKPVPDSTERIGGYMRFDSDDPAKLFALLEQNPVIQHGGTIELCELPVS